MLPLRQDRTKGPRSRALWGTTPPEEGQSLVEMTFGVIFLILVILILFEMAMVFRAYIALLNASREGAFYASAHPSIKDSSEMQDCDSAGVGGSDYETYVWITCQEAVASGLNTSAIMIQKPEAPVVAAQEPITVTLQYELVNPTHGIILPWLGRMGLASSFPIAASTKTPIRLGAD